MFPSLTSVFRYTKIIVITVEEHNYKLRKARDTGLIFLSIKPIQNSRPEVLCKKDVLKNFVKLTGKNLCWSFFCRP